MCEDCGYDEYTGLDAVDIWTAAAVLHDEAHADDRTPFALCARPACVGVKDVVWAGWREYRPEAYRVAV